MLIGFKIKNVLEKFRLDNKFCNDSYLEKDNIKMI